MCSDQLRRRALNELDDVLEEMIQRNPEQYQDLINLIESKLHGREEKSSGTS
jgi:hypothetical protein